MTAYADLDARLRKVHTLGTIQSLLGWDEEVNLPADSVDQRKDQKALLAGLAHESFVDPEIGKLLASLEKDLSPLSDDERVVVRETRIDYDRSVKLPAEFVDRSTRLRSDAYHAWADARKRDDFPAFAPYIQKFIDLSKEHAAYLGWQDRPYDLAIDLHDPGMDAATIAALFSDLKAELVPIVDRILGSSTKPRTDFFKGFPVDKQKAFLEEVTASLGFNYKRGRIDVSLHPFCSGNGADIRMTTRFDEDNPLDSLFSSIHETGHGLYEQGLPLAHLHNALGNAAGMGVHESQSRLWENQVCRSRAFWKHFEPKLRAAFPEQLKAISSEELYLAINAVTRCPIRVDSDEVTYNLHIIIRFEIEQKLFNGELKVSDLPEYWNAQYKAYLGIDPKSDSEGVLQDVHWSHGSFGYFPSYCLGNMLAAQLWDASRQQLPNLEADFERGDFSRLLNWLQQKIHRHGKRHYLRALAQQATGHPLSPNSLIAYLKDRYLPLYRQGRLSVL